MSEENSKEYKRAVEDLSAHARKVDAAKLKGQIKVVTKDDIKRLIDAVIQSHKGLSQKELIAKISEYQLQIKNLENQRDQLQARLKKALEDLENVASRALTQEDLDKATEELRRELAAMREQLLVKDGEIEDLERKLKEALDALAESRELLESKDRRISDLEALAGEDSLKAKIAELQKKMADMEAMYKAQIKTLKEYIFELEVALEFVDVMRDVGETDFADPVAEARECMSRLEGADVPETLAPAFEMLGRRIESVYEGFARSGKLIEEMENGNGSIAVVNEIENINARSLWALEDLETVNKMLAAICSLADR